MTQKRQKAITKMHQQPENSSTLLKQGELYFLQGNHQLAEKHFLHVIKRYPNLAEAHNNLGVIYWQTNQLEKSIEHFKRALSINPQNQDAIANLKQISDMLKNDSQIKNSPMAQTASVSKVLASLSDSKAHTGIEQGGLYLVDLEKREWEQVINLNDLPMPPEKRYRDRRISGIAQHKDQLYLTAGDKLFIYNRQFEPIEAHDNPYLENCHGIVASGNRLFLTSTGFDSILVFDLVARKFIEGYHIKYSATAHSLHLLPFNPESEKGPSSGNTIHLNTVYIHGSKLYFSCQKLDRFFCVQENGVMDAMAQIPLGTHAARPYKEGFLIPSTNGPTLNHLDFNGTMIESFNAPLSVERSDSGFTSSLCVIDNDLIIASASPSTLLGYRSGHNEPTLIVNIAVKNACSIDALEVWTL